MANDATTPVAPAVDADAPTPTVETTATTEPDPAGAEALGDPGKKALDAMKAERNEARKAAQAAQTELERLKAAAEGREAEWKAEKDATAAAEKRFNERVLSAEIRAAAAGKMADPADALRYIDIAEFTVGEDGAVDSAAINDAIAALVNSKPYLAAQSEPRITGSPDAGPRNAEQQGQLTKDQLASMTPEQINAARRAGRLNSVLGIS